MSDHTEELIACLETMADWLDLQEPDGAVMSDELYDEFIAAVAQTLELVQALLAEHAEAVHQINSFVGAMAMAKQKAHDETTGLIVANAGEMKKYIK